MNKKGAELALNTLIIVILVVIVLIVVAIFFLGGTSSLSRSIRTIFFGATAGTDLNLAVEQCNNHCANAQALPNYKLSGYCRITYNLDMNTDGKLDENNDKLGIKCWQDPINNVCLITTQVSGKDASGKDIVESVTERLDGEGKISC